MTENMVSEDTRINACHGAGATPPKLIGVLTLNLMDLLALETPIYTTIQKLGQGYQMIAFAYSSSALG